jgi:hypothetical protein
MSCNSRVIEHPRQDAITASTTRIVIGSRPRSESKDRATGKDESESTSSLEASGSVELNRLLVVVDPLPEENIIGFLIRLTELNDYDKLAWILGLSKLSVGLYSGIALFFNRGQDLSRLVKLTDISEAELRSLQYSLVETARQTTGYRFFGRTLSWTRLGLRRPRVCPQCLRQFGFVSKLWDLSAYTACVIHKCLLMEHCPQCGKRIKWNRNRISFCGHCGSDWTKVISPSLEEGNLKVSQQIHCLCNGQQEQTEGRVGRGCNPLASLDLEYLLTALYFIARQTKALGEEGGRQPSLSNSQLHKALADSWQVFEEWPGKFWDFLGSYRTDRGNESGLSVGRQFGGLYNKFLQNLCDPCFDFIRIGFDDYLRDRWDGKYEPDRQRAFRERLDKSYISEHTAGLRLGSSKVRVRQLIKHGKIKATQRRSGSFLVDISSVDEYKQQFADSLSTTELQSMIGVSYSGVEDLIKQGYLNPFSGPTVDGGPTWRIKRDDVLNLVARIEKNIRSVPFDSRRQIVGFDYALRLFSRLGAGLTEFLQLILDKDIRPCGMTNSAATTFSKFKFDKQAVLAYVRRQMQQRKQDVLFLKEAVTELGITEDTAHFLRDKGILKVEINRPGLWRGSIITRAAIEDFKSNYVSAGELARGLKTSPNRILELLANKKVHPIMGPSLDGCYQYLYRRSDVESIGVDLKQLSIDERIGSIARDPRIRVSVDQIADILHISVDKVDHLIESGLLLPVKPQLRSCDSNVFNGYAVLRYIRLMGGRDDLVSAPIAAEMLGVRNGYLPYFVRMGKLIPVALKEKDRFKYFSREDVERLVRLRQAKNR